MAVDVQYFLSEVQLGLTHSGLDAQNNSSADSSVMTR